MGTNEQILDKLKILECLTDAEKQMLAHSLDPVELMQGDHIATQDDNCSSLEILCDGEVSMIVDGEEVDTLSANAASGGTIEYFGETALFENYHHEATVEVTSATARVLSLDRDHVNILLGSFKKICQSRKNAEEFEDWLSKVAAKRRTLVSRRTMVLEEVLERRRRVV